MQSTPIIPAPRASQAPSPLDELIALARQRHALLDRASLDQAIPAALRTWQHAVTERFPCAWPLLAPLAQPVLPKHGGPIVECVVLINAERWLLQHPFPAIWVLIAPNKRTYPLEPLLPLSEEDQLLLSIAEYRAAISQEDWFVPWP